jgi:hypothetical protein
MHVAGPATETGSAVAIRDADRAEQTEVVQVKDGPGPSLLSGRERTPPEQGLDVVGVDHVGTHAFHSARHGFWLDAAGHKRSRRFAAPDGVARALEDFDLVAVAPQQLCGVRDRAFFAALQAVAIM